MRPKLSQIKSKIPAPRAAIAALANEAVPLNTNGTNRFDNYKTYASETDGGTSPAYLTARIARDHPAYNGCDARVRICRRT